MLLPPSAPASSCKALGFRLSEVNWDSTPWAANHGAAPRGPPTASHRAASPTALVQPRKRRPREVRRENLVVILPRPRPTDRPPLAETDPMSPAGARGHEPRHLAAVLRDGELEGGAAELAVELGTQHRAHVGAGDEDVAAREPDLQLADAPRASGAAHRDVRDALQAVPAHVHHRRQRPRQYSAQLAAVPLLAPAKPRRDVAVVAAAAARVGDRPQVGPGLRRLEDFVDCRGAEAAGRVEVGVDDGAPVLEHLAACDLERVPRLRRLARDARVDLVAHVGERIEALGLPAAAVLEREAARHYRLGEHRLPLAGPPRSHLVADHAREIGLDRDAVHEREP